MQCCTFKLTKSDSTLTVHVHAYSVHVYEVVVRVSSRAGHQANWTAVRTIFFMPGLTI